MTTKKPTKGGARPGAGRKKKLPAAVVEAKLDGRTAVAKSVAGKVLEKANAEQLWLSMIAIECDRLNIDPATGLRKPKPEPAKPDPKAPAPESTEKKVSGPDYPGHFSIIPLTNLLKYLDDRHYGRPVDTVNHVHDKPIDLNVNVTLRTRMQRAEERFKNALATRARN